MVNPSPYILSPFTLCKSRSQLHLRWYWAVPETSGVSAVPRKLPVADHLSTCSSLPRRTGRVEVSRRVIGRLPRHPTHHAFKRDSFGSCGCVVAMSSHLTYKIASTLRLPTRGTPTTLSINPEGTLVACGSADGSVLIWSLQSYELFCQAYPPLMNGNSAVNPHVTNMTWVSNGLLAFSRKNGLMSVMLVEKVNIRVWVNWTAEAPLLALHPSAVPRSSRPPARTCHGLQRHDGLLGNSDSQRNHFRQVETRRL